MNVVEGGQRGVQESGTKLHNPCWSKVGNDQNGRVKGGGNFFIFSFHVFILYKDKMGIKNLQKEFCFFKKNSEILF